MKKILHVVSSFQRGGTEAFIMNSLRNINREEFIFDIFITTPANLAVVSKEYLDEIELLGGKVYYGIGMKSKIKFMLGLNKCIRENGPYHAVHSNIDIANSWIMLSAYFSKVKIRVSHSHSTMGKEASSYFKKGYYYILEKLLLLFSTEKLACGEDAGSYLYREKYFKKSGKILKNGIDIKKFLYIDIDKIEMLKGELNIKEGSFVLINITRFDKNKNISFVIDVFKEILVIKPNSVLILGGIDGGELQKIIQKVYDLEIEDSVRFVGIRNDVNLLLNLSDAYIFPSYKEGLSFSILEAQAANLPCFISNSVTKEVDLGLGLSYFIDLKEEAHYWAKLIMDNYEKKVSEIKQIEQTFLLSGYSIESTIKDLERIYS